MGVIVFLLASMAIVLFSINFFRDLSRVSCREPFALGYPRASLVEPLLTPVEQVKSPERLPQIKLDFASIATPTPVVDRSTEVSSNFITAPSKTEESLLFRSLTLGMFALAVISVDLAAGTHYSGVGIPVTAMGAVWSWYRRHHPRHWLNISVSVGSLAIVCGCLVPILVSQMQIATDLVAPSVKMSTMLELALGLILVAIQMGLSFNLYHRRLLGYCLVTSGVLMAVAASLSHALSFLILLCGFIAIAIPTLMLDYRSRLALQPVGIAALPTPKQLSYRHLPWRYLSQLAAISLGLGLMLSVFLPNFHFPPSFPATQGDLLQTLAQKSYLPKITPQRTSSSQQASTPPANIREIATKFLSQPGNNNYPDIIKQDNLQLPPELATQLQQTTHQILATSPQPLKSDYDRAAYLADYLKQHHQSPLADLANLPPIDAKLIQQLTAKCAAAPQTCKLVGSKQDVPVVYTSMLRSIGIPARLKMDDKLAQIDPQTKLYPRPTAQTQSQTEVYFPNWGWLSLDSTPDRPLFNLDDRQREQLQQQLQQLAGTPPNAPNQTPAAITPQPSIDHPSPPTPSPSESPKWQPDPAMLKAIVLMICIGGGIAGYLWYRRQQQQQLADLPPIERIYRSMLLSLSKQGRAKLPAQTQLEYAQSVSHTEHPQIAKVVWEISQVYTAWRYGKHRIDVQQLTKKLQYLQHLQQLAANRKRPLWFSRQKSRADTSK
ncbi:MAG: DUF4129 domain-containing transglutaminase family protein [Chamaesiphon sp.]|nr:DUF4129 domain-containing transglutaminase family protein [Chamaesiphon sp.]